MRMPVRLIACGSFRPCLQLYMAIEEMAPPVITECSNGSAGGERLSVCGSEGKLINPQKWSKADVLEGAVNIIASLQGQVRTTPVWAASQAGRQPATRQTSGQCPPSVPRTSRLVITRHAITRRVVTRRVITRQANTRRVTHLSRAHLTHETPPPMARGSSQRSASHASSAYRSTRTLSSTTAPRTRTMKAARSSHSRKPRSSP